jgi:predicted DNA-binding WGR domain protein
MTVMNEIAILLQGRNPEANRRRAWRVEGGPDLFGKWIVRVSFRRIGCRGRTIAREFPSEEEAQNYVQNGLRRRRSAIRRCGVDYRVIDASAAALVLLEVVRLSSEPKSFHAAESRLDV